MICLNGMVLFVVGGLVDIFKSMWFFVLLGINMCNYVMLSLLVIFRCEWVKGIVIGVLCFGVWILVEVGFFDEK